jgi:hypothetical protein
MGRGATKLKLKKNESGCVDLLKASKLGHKDAVKLITAHCK